MTEELKRGTIIYRICKFLPEIYRRILKDCQTPKRFNQGISKRLEMDRGRDKSIRKTEALLHNRPNPCVF
jgi:hypothetical protein